VAERGSRAGMGDEVGERESSEFQCCVDRAVGEAAPVARAGRSARGTGGAAARRMCVDGTEFNWSTKKALA